MMNNNVTDGMWNPFPIALDLDVSSFPSGDVPVGPVAWVAHDTLSLSSTFRVLSTLFFVAQCRSL